MGYPKRFDEIHAVMLNFDDGYEGVYTNALPILEAHGLKATVGIITDPQEDPSRSDLARLVNGVPEPDEWYEWFESPPVEWVTVIFEEDQIEALITLPNGCYRVADWGIVQETLIENVTDLYTLDISIEFMDGICAETEQTVTHTYTLTEAPDEIKLLIYNNNILFGTVVLVRNLELVDSEDTDNDGIPDVWENSHGLDVNDPSDALLDSDGDGLTNLEEYLHANEVVEIPINPIEQKIMGLPKIWFLYLTIGFLALTLITWNNPRFSKHMASETRKKR